MKQERRRCHRTTLPLDVTLEAAGGWGPAKTLSLSPYGAKVAWLPKVGTLLSGTTVQLRLPAPNGDPPISFSGRVERTDPDGIALSFPNLSGEKFQRVKALVDSLLLQEWRELASQLGARSPVEAAEATKAGASSPKPVEGTQPRKQEEPTRHDQSEQERWRIVLQRLGLQNLRLPIEGPLARQWREFLERHEVEE